MAKKKKQSPKKVLADHKRVGKKFIPPMAQLGMKEVDYIERIIPELAWIRYFIVTLGERHGIHTALKLIKEASLLETWKGHSKFSFQSAYRRLSEDHWQKLQTRLKEEGILQSCQDALAAFVRCYPTDNAFAGLLGDAQIAAPSDEDIQFARDVVRSLFDRRAKPASAVQSVVLVSELEAGSLKFTSAIRFPDLNAIFSDFESEASQHACSHVRIQTNFIFMFADEEIGNAWARYFWNRGKDLAPIKSEIAISTETYAADAHPLVKFSIDYEKYAWELVDEIWSKLPIDIYADECFSVLGALLARQCNFATTLASNYFLWDFRTGPLFLRAMTDAYIAAAWILKDPTDRARKFILYGLGQEKLRIEHFKSILHKHEPDDRRVFEKVIEGRERWLDNQHFSFLQHVDVGSWSGISTREMAEQAGCINLYNFAYTPWSFVAHGTWNHIASYDAVPSREPLHKYIWQPFNGDFGRHPDIIVNGTKYFDKLCRLLVDAFDLKVSRPLPRQWLRPRLNQLFKEMPQPAEDEQEKDAT
jgi:uncharacterized protein DUF5677